MLIVMKKNIQKKQIEKTTVKSLTSDLESNKKQGAQKISPLGSRVLIRPFTKEELEKKNSFGIILPESNTKEKAEQGIVLAVGPGEFRDGVLVPVAVKVGDKICFSKYGYDDIKVDDEELYLIKEENVLAILN